MRKINIREALLRLDKRTDCQYDLTTLYEACDLDEKDKKKLVQYIDGYEDPASIGKFLETRCDAVCESIDDDDVSDMKLVNDVSDMKLVNDINNDDDHALWELMNKFEEEDLQPKDLTEDVHPDEKVAIARRIREVATGVLVGKLGYEEDFVDDYMIIDVDDVADNTCIKVEVRAEVDYDGLMTLGQALDPIVKEYDKKAYFEPVTSGTMSAYIRKDQSEDIPDEAAVKEWTDRFNACQTKDDVIAVYRDLIKVRDNNEVTWGTIEAIYDVIDAKMDSLGESLTEDFNTSMLHAINLATERNERFKFDLQSFLTLNDANSIDDLSEEQLTTFYNGIKSIISKTKDNVPEDVLSAFDLTSTDALSEGARPLSKNDIIYRYNFGLPLSDKDIEKIGTVEEHQQNSRNVSEIIKGIKKIIPNCSISKKRDWTSLSLMLRTIEPITKDQQTECKEFLKQFPYPSNIYGADTYLRANGFISLSPVVADLSEELIEDTSEWFVGDSETGRMYKGKDAAQKAYDRLVKSGIKDAVMHPAVEEAFDVDKVAKRIARHNEFDNGYVLHNYEKMTSAEAEEKARLASIEDPDDIYYVSYDNIMNPSSDIKWKNGQQLTETVDADDGWVKRWSFADKYYKDDLVISKISSPVDAWHLERVAPNGHTIEHLGNYNSLEAAKAGCTKKNESKLALNESDDTDILYDMEDYDEDNTTVTAGNQFIEDGYTWTWFKQCGETVHLDFDNWAVWWAYRPEIDGDENSTAISGFFIVDTDTGFIDWGPCDTIKEAQEFLQSKVNDWENDDLDESINESISTELKNYLEKVKKLELKAMYSLDPDDDAFGIETDLYARVSETLDGKRTPESLLAYFEKYYSEYEKDFIDNVKKLINSHSTPDSNIDESKSIKEEIGDNYSNNIEYCPSCGEYLDGSDISDERDNSVRYTCYHCGNTFDRTKYYNKSKSIKEGVYGLTIDTYTEFIENMYRDLEIVQSCKTFEEIAQHHNDWGVFRWSNQFKIWEDKGLDFRTAKRKAQEQIYKLIDKAMDDKKTAKSQTEEISTLIVQLEDYIKNDSRYEYISSDDNGIYFDPVGFDNINQFVVDIAKKFNLRSGMFSFGSSLTKHDAYTPETRAPLKIGMEDGRGVVSIPTIIDESKSIKEDIDSNLEAVANRLFNSLKEYGANKITKYTDVYQIYFNNSEDDSDATLVHYDIQSEGFKEVTEYGNEPNVTEYINEDGTVCAKLLIYKDSISVEVSKEDTSQYNESLKENIGVGNLVTHVDDASGTRGIVVELNDDIAKVCVGDPANNDYVEVPLDKLQLDESLKEGVEKYIIGATERGLNLYYNAKEDHMSTDMKAATQYAERAVAVDDYKAVKERYPTAYIRSTYDLPLLNKPTTKVKKRK